jgi:hypothetical protein
MTYTSERLEDIRHERPSGTIGEGELGGQRPQLRISNIEHGISNVQVKISKK